jgi:hypothetical protein
MVIALCAPNAWLAFADRRLHHPGLFKQHHTCITLLFLQCTHKNLISDLQSELSFAARSILLECSRERLLQDLSTAQPENLCIIQHKHQMGLYGPWTMCPTPETRILKGSVPGCENHGTRDDDRRRHDDKNIKFLRTVTVTTSLASRAICVRNIDCYLSVVYTMYGTSAF